MSLDFRYLLLAGLLLISGCWIPVYERPKTFAPDDYTVPGATVIYFHPDEPTRPIIPVRLNAQHEAAMILDTGAAYCVLSRSTCSHAGVLIRKSDMETIDGNGRRSKVEGEGTIDYLDIGDARFEQTNIVVNGIAVLRERVPPTFETRQRM